MGEERTNFQIFWVWWKRYGEHLTAPLILIALIILGFQMADYLQLQKEISNNCGWDGEGYECYCKKSKALEIKAIIEEQQGILPELNLSNITVVNNNG